MMQPLIRIFERRVRGVRLIEAVGILLAVGMIFWVCLSKAREDGDVKQLTDLDSQIAEQQSQVDALKVRVAELERPARLEQLAVAYLGMKPVSPNHEAHIDSLAEISQQTSKPVAANAVIIPANAPVAPAASNDLISTQAAASPSTAPTPPVVAAAKPAPKPAGAL
jgi:cell division protein FtsL